MHNTIKLLFMRNKMYFINGNASEDKGEIQHIAIT